MTFPLEDVRRLARAQRLSLAPDEEATLARDIDRILEAFGSLPAAPGEVAWPAAGPPREDVAEEADAERRAAILSQVPRRSGDHVKVPRRSDR
ncbi:MAG TPA: Asp-tRNA(Asn)/Glu-tRNA(Gln) amidotransferase subunit GatC [Candidatus Thermoplasmatota archaeon]|nr:Asp-tRNA(Asn)/Glu-tRNA(Gln) amidotransferase subunit GatC [Candidatus Thermoplasmatota archaeon]